LQTFAATLQWVQQRNANKHHALHSRLEEVQQRVEEKVWHHARNFNKEAFFCIVWSKSSSRMTRSCLFSAVVQNVQLSEVMRAAQLDEVVLRNVTEKLESVMTSKNQQNKHLKYEISRVQKVYSSPTLNFFISQHGYLRM
jgi:hypothetical protein